MSNIRPLVLVLDLDSTLIYWDDGKKIGRYSRVLENGTTIYYPAPGDLIYYRPGIRQMIQNLRYLIGQDNLYVIIWTMGDDDYAQEVLASIDFGKDELLVGQINDIWATSMSKDSNIVSGANKGAKFILQSPAILRWLDRINWDQEPPFTVLVDDMAKLNAGVCTKGDQTGNYDMLIDIVRLENSTTIETDMDDIYCAIIEGFRYELVIPNGLPIEVDKGYDDDDDDDAAAANYGGYRGLNTYLSRA
jgi:NLI interacting factor-like phosphatase